jgi:F0F1-type ATP synthase delta subunit
MHFLWHNRVVVVERHTPAIDRIVTTDTLSFLCLLVDKKRMLLIKDITKEFETIFNEEDPEHEPRSSCFRFS